MTTVCATCSERKYRHKPCRTKMAELAADVAKPTAPLTHDELAEVWSGIVAAGYMQLDSNEYGLTDFGSACQITIENSDLNCGERMIGWFIRVTEAQVVDLKKRFLQEFTWNAKMSPAEKRVLEQEMEPEPFKAVPGTPAFWDDLKLQFNLK